MNISEIMREEGHPLAVLIVCHYGDEWWLLEKGDPIPPEASANKFTLKTINVFCDTAEDPVAGAILTDEGWLVVEKDGYTGEWEVVRTFARDENIKDGIEILSSIGCEIQLDSIDWPY